MAIAPTFGVGLSMYMTDYLAMTLEWRALPFSWNTSGTNEVGNPLDEAVIDDQDRLSHFNHLFTLGFAFYLPTEPGRSHMDGSTVSRPRGALRRHLAHTGLRFVAQQGGQPLGLALPGLVGAEIPVLAGVAARQLTAKLEAFAHHIGARPLDAASDDQDRTMPAFRHEFWASRSLGRGQAGAGAAGMRSPCSLARRHDHWGFLCQT